MSEAGVEGHIGDITVFIDVEHLIVLMRHQVYGFAGLFHEIVQVWACDLQNAQSADGAAADLEHAQRLPVLAGVRILGDIAHLPKRRKKTMCRALGEARLLREHGQRHAAGTF